MAGEATGHPGEVAGAGAAAWRAVACHELRDGWPRWVSFACIWLWTCLLGGTGFSAALAGQIGGIVALPTWLTLCATVVTLAVILSLSDALATVVGSRGAMTLAGVLLVAGGACVAVPAPLASPALFAAGACMGGAAIGFLKIAWGEMFSRMSLQAGLVSMGLAVASSSAAFLVLLTLPEVVQRVALVAAAVPCAPLAVRGTRLLADDPTPPPPPGAARAIKFSWTLLLLPALVGFSAALLSGALLMRPAVQGDPTVTVLNAAGDLAVGLFLLASSRALSARYGASQIYAVGLIFSVAGTAMASATSIPTWASCAVNNLGFAIFYFFMVVYWGDLARRVGSSVVRTYALGYATFMAAQVPGDLIGYATAASGAQATLALVLMAVILAFFMLSLLVFGNAHSPLRQWLTAGEPAETTDAIPDACAAITARCGLSPREREVLSLLARGRTASFIGRSLGISPDTAKTHMRSIYRKLDVHTQQELIELVTAEAARV